MKLKLRKYCISLPHTPLTNNPASHLCTALSVTLRARHAQVVRQQYKGDANEVNVYFVIMNNMTQVTRSAVTTLRFRWMTKLVYPYAGDSISQANRVAVGDRVTRNFGSYNFNQQMHTVFVWFK
jgi:hypothetical protein